MVRQAAAEFEKLAFTDGNVLGGRKAIASTNFGTAGNPMFDDHGPGCWMYKQGSFITAFFPKDVQADLDANVGVFCFPPATAGGDKPILGGGDMAMLLSDQRRTPRRCMKMLSDTTSATRPCRQQLLHLPAQGLRRRAVPERARPERSPRSPTTSTTFLFDGSDQMPGAVGAGTFWKDMTSWISGQEDLDTALKNIDASWPCQLTSLRVEHDVAGGCGSSARTPGGAHVRTHATACEKGVAHGWQSSHRADHGRGRRRCGARCSTGSSTRSPSCCRSRWEDRIKPYLYILPAFAGDRPLPACTRRS